MCICLQSILGAFLRMWVQLGFVILMTNNDCLFSSELGQECSGQANLLRSRLKGYCVPAPLLASRSKKGKWVSAALATVCEFDQKCSQHLSHI